MILVMVGAGMILISLIPLLPFPVPVVEESFHEAVADAGYQTSSIRYLSSIGGEDATSSVLVLASPTPVPSAVAGGFMTNYFGSDIEFLNDFLRAGGNIILADASYAGASIGDVFGIDFHRTSEEGDGSDLLVHGARGSTLDWSQNWSDGTRENYSLDLAGSSALIVRDTAGITRPDYSLMSRNDSYLDANGDGIDDSGGGNCTTADTSELSGPCLLMLEK